MHSADILPVPSENTRARASDHIGERLHLDRLHELKDRLTECLVDAEDIRARIADAREANVWPDLGPAARLFADYNDSRRAR